MVRCAPGQVPRTSFRVYYEWRFRTGVEGDFESLVRALVPRDMDPRVGVRDMSIATPGFGVPTATNPPDGRVGLEGALLAPTTVRRGLDPASDFAPQIAAVVNAPADARGAAGAAASAPAIRWSRRRSMAAGTQAVERVKMPAAIRAGSTRSMSTLAIARPPGWARRVIRTHQEKLHATRRGSRSAMWCGEPHDSPRTARRRKAAAAAYAKTLNAYPQSHGARRADIRAHHGELDDACMRW